ncbi:ABC transporter ATP-binding protein [soil metagenome]
MRAPTPEPADACSIVLEAEGVTLAYDKVPVVTDLDLTITAGSFTVLIGPNACGKSTALRGLARLLSPTGGRVLLDGRDIATRKTREIARELALLPQSPITPSGVTVADLVSRGRAPYQSLLRQYSREDERAVASAMVATGVQDLADRPVDELSGGQRQRVWIAVALAQETDILLLDEPTTYLDLAHQIEVLDLCARLHAGGRTLVVVLHDLNMAARYATELVAFTAGRIVAQGSPRDVVTPPILSEVFGLAADVIPDPQTGTPLVVPHRPPHLAR